MTGTSTAPVWDDLSGSASATWYLDPLVAAQKRSAYLSLLERWTAGVRSGVLLKTDLFEEANGGDEILSGLCGFAGVIGIDVSFGQVSRARTRCSMMRNARFLATDVRQLALAPDSVDVVFSNSTLDHFEDSSDLDRSLQEVFRVLRPGGVAIVALDNGRNPLYWLLRLATATGVSPFPVGVTTSLSGLVKRLTAAGLEPTATDCLIHNPRVLSTAIFLLVRRVLGVKGERAIERLLKAFALFDRLPTRGWTACFVAVRARKPNLAASSVSSRSPAEFHRVI